METSFDAISLGSTMIRLSVPVGARLETSPVYEVRTAGTESNAMAALARMGKKTAWVSRLTDNALGRRLANEIRYHGVDVSRVIWTDEDRNEVFFVEPGQDPRPTQVIYDRKHSAVANISLCDPDMDFLLSGKILHLTGIFPALSDRCLEAAAAVIEAARQAGKKVSFDLNYRAKLWTPKQAREALSPLIRNLHILILTQEDAGDVLDIHGQPRNMVEACYQAFIPHICVVTLKSGGAVAFDGNDHYECRGHKVEIVDRLGAGDSFTAGLLYGYLEGSLQTGLEYGAAMAALALSLHGDYLVSDRFEIERLMSGGSGREVGR